MKKEMTSKERVLTAFARQEPDRVPINYSSNPGIDGRLKEHFGLAADDDEGLRQALGVDFRGVHPRYVGPKLHADVPAARGQLGHPPPLGRARVGRLLGLLRLPPAGRHRGGGRRLAHARSPDDFDYSEIAETCRRYGQLRDQRRRRLRRHHQRQRHSCAPWSRR